MKTFSRLLRRYLLAAVGIVLLMFVLSTSFLGWVLWREGQRPQREYSYSNIADSMVQTADGLAFRRRPSARSTPPKNGWTATPGPWCWTPTAG